MVIRKREKVLETVITCSREVLSKGRISTVELLVLTSLDQLLLY